jgi:hypothetical protein
MANPTDIARQAEQLNEIEWFDFLDQLDEVARRRQQTVPPEPTGSNRDEVAAWVARKHFVVDNKIREIWYLPANSSSDEIRLIESNDRFGGEWGFEPLDFDVEINENHFKLVVCEVSGQDLELLRKDPSTLPAGWTLDQVKIWRRGA